MLARYQIVRGKRPPGSPLPDGIRIDVRKHTHHVLSPDAEAVVGFLADPSIAAFRQFSSELGGEQRKGEGGVLRWPGISAHRSARGPCATRSRDARDRCLGVELGSAGGVAREVLARARTVPGSGCTSD